MAVSRVNDNNRYFSHTSFENGQIEFGFIALLFSALPVESSDSLVEKLFSMGVSFAVKEDTLGQLLLEQNPRTRFTCRR